ncbi:MAG: hypothetical protein KAG94_00030 [Clostridiales bacterium]|nr:hypothetical protein [Clostridiales bacterium]
MNNSGKTNGCLIAVIVTLIIFIIAAAAVYFVFFLDRSEMPDVKEFISEVEASERTTDNNSSITDVIKIQTDKGGSSKINIVLTNADLTALANDTVDSNDNIPFEDLLFNCNSDKTIDVTGVVTDLSVYVDSPDVPALIGTLLSSANGKRIYATIYINYIGGNEFDIDIQNIKIGKMTLPIIQSIFDPMTNDIADMLKDQLDTQENFEMQDFIIEENQLSFSGIITE